MASKVKKPSRLPSPELATQGHDLFMEGVRRLIRSRHKLRSPEATSEHSEKIRKLGLRLLIISENGHRISYKDLQDGSEASSYEAEAINHLVSLDLVHLTSEGDTLIVTPTSFGQELLSAIQKVNTKALSSSDQFMLPELRLAQSNKLKTAVRQLLGSGKHPYPNMLLSDDELYDKAVAMVTQSKKASTSHVMLELQIGYNTASRLMERMEREGLVVSPSVHGATEHRPKSLLDKSDGLDRPDKYRLNKGPIARELRDEGISLSKDDPRLGLLDRFAAENPGKPVSDYLLKLFATPAEELSKLSVSAEEKAKASEAPPLPTRAPERWPANASKRTETPPEFVVRVYGPWMAAGVLTRPYLKRLDPPLFSSLDNWLKNNNRKDHPSPLPEGYSLKSAYEKNDEWVKRVQSGQEPLPTSPNELARLSMALRRRDRADGREK